MLKDNDLVISNSAIAELIEASVSRKNSLRFKARGFSMFPFICNNDIVTVSPIFNNRINVGCIVAYRYSDNKSLAIHRMIGRCGCGYIIKGDNLSAIDGVIKREDILGYISAVNRKGRRVTFGISRMTALIVFLSRIRAISLLSMLARRCIPKFLKRLIYDKLF